MKKIRYAVLGLGHIAQTAVLPAFKNAKQNSELVALISSDEKKLKKLAKKYKVASTYSEDNFTACLESGQIDALYIATPNTDHKRYAEEAARCGVHVLCEKPLAPTSEECRSIQNVADKFGIKFMVAYRLHFDPANLKVIELAQAGKIGDLRIFNSNFSFQVEDPENIRLKKAKAGGPLYDIGVYCINAARYLFRDEPQEVYAFESRDTEDERFSEVPEMVSVSMKFSENRIASFVCSFGAADTSYYDLVGTKGSICLDSAYEYAADRELILTIGEKEKTFKFEQKDQFAAELIYFSKCIQNNKTPEPSATEGLADICVIEAIQQSIKTGAAVKVKKVVKHSRPTMHQKISRPAIKMPETVNVTSPSGKH